MINLDRAADFGIKLKFNWLSCFPTLNLNFRCSIRNPVSRGDVFGVAQQSSVCTFYIFSLTAIYLQ